MDSVNSVLTTVSLAQQPYQTALPVMNLNLSFMLMSVYRHVQMVSIVTLILHALLVSILAPHVRQFHSVSHVWLGMLYIMGTHVLKPAHKEQLKSLIFANLVQMTVQLVREPLEIVRLVLEDYFSIKITV